MPGKITNPYAAISYTDGSGISNCFGAGVYGPRDNHRDRRPMGNLSTVFPVEVMPENATRRRTHICSDSRVEIAEPVKTTTESALARESVQALGKLSAANKVTSEWEPDMMEYREMNTLINWQ